MSRDDWKKNWVYPDIYHGKPTKYNWVVMHPEMLNMGFYVDIGAFTLIQAEYGVDIGHDVQIGGGCMIYSKNTIDGTRGRVNIHKDAKIGANSVVLPGVIIGKGVTIGALSLVKFNVTSGVWAGNPLRRIK
jgi:acetyltransferase-like isoleucine patch superfamily enzyme